jgi:hypothetical protein
VGRHGPGSAYQRSLFQSPLPEACGTTSSSRSIARARRSASPTTRRHCRKPVAAPGAARCVQGLRVSTTPTGACCATRKSPAC